MSARRARRTWIAIAAAAAIAACRHDNDAVLLVVVTASGSPAPVAALDVTITGPAGAATARYPSAGAAPIAFPTTLSVQIPARAAGNLGVAVQATDATGTAIAAGYQGPISVPAGARETVYLNLDCGGSPCVIVAGGGPAADGGTVNPSCGNGSVDPGETCDTAIAAGDPGACPPADCDDGVACTTDTRTGSDCTAECTHQLIVAAAPNDGCCPPGATYAKDSDCSASCGNGTVDPGEMCDIAIAAGQPGACPTDADCPNDVPCALTLLASAGTCSAICLHYPITAPSGQTTDNCCPPGAVNASDVDCPVMCGNGIEEPGETCDVDIPAFAPGGCPRGCDDGDPCTTDFASGAACDVACVHLAITAAISGDGCCPANATHATDTDCPASCGDGVVEPGEACDKGVAVGPTACPASCPPPPSACLQTALVGGADDCTARCVTSPITACSNGVNDGCCPAGCTSANDPDCPSPATCGNGVVDTAARERCDTAIRAGQPGACPTACSDGNPCTADFLIGSGCAAICAFVPITAFQAGDGCCPLGGNFSIDPDCAPQCGNGVVEAPAESCDGVASCPQACTQTSACTSYTLTGDPSLCNASCVPTSVTACINGDRCCPPGCSAATDDDCPVVCGDGVVETGEACDKGITAGFPGACARSCDDGDACTVDLAAGSVESCTRSCQHARITACLDDDGCCPAGCSAATDDDCGSACNDGHVGDGETCDPQSTCPTTCPDDGDPCTREQLTGDPAQCDVACRHIPITTCSGAASDACCPTGCTAATDSDC